MADRGMGRGLAAILSLPSAGDAEPELRELPVELIAPNPRQPRRHFDEQSLRSLAGSVTERGVPLIIQTGVGLPDGLAMRFPGLVVRLKPTIASVLVAQLEILI